MRPSLPSVMPVCGHGGAWHLRRGRAFLSGALGLSTGES
jgi:hypothetical protein